MNIIQGLEMKGLTLNTQENFNSIPGLTLWLDGSERKVLRPNTGNVMFTWTSKKEPFHQLVYPGGVFTSVVSEVKSIKTKHSITESGNLFGGAMSKSSFNDFDFIRTGAFGIYAINRHWKALGTGGDNNATLPFEAGNFALGRSGFSFNNTSNGTSGGVRISFSNDAVATYNFATLISNNAAPLNSINSYSYVFRGNGVINNHHLRVNDATKLTSTQDVNLLYPISSIAVNRLQNTRNATTESWLILVYNFNGMSSTIIDQYDARIRTQLEQYKLTVI